MGNQDNLVSKYVTVITVVSLYWFVSISLVFINKYLLSNKEFKIDAPLFITFFQCCVTVLLCNICSYCTSLMPTVFFFPNISFSTDALKAVFPLSIIFVAMITFNNLCLKHVGVPFYYIGRSLTTVFNVILTVAVLHQKVSFKALVCCVVIILGFVLGVQEEGIAGSLSMSGVVYGVLASFFVSLFSVLMKKVLPAMDNSIWKLTYYNNVNAILLFIPLIIVFGEVTVLLNFENFFNSDFWALMILGGTFGFAIGYVTGLQIKPLPNVLPILLYLESASEFQKTVKHLSDQFEVTSPLTHNISGTAKACAQTVIAVLWFSEVKSVLWWVSNTTVLLGSAAYTRVQQLQMMKDHEQTKQLKKLERSPGEQSV